MKNKSLLITLSLTSFLYYVIPLLFLKFYNGTSDKAGFILILFYICAAFAINVIIPFFLERKIYVPISSIIFALPLVFIFNNTVTVLIGIIFIFSFLGYAISSLLK
ncbi:hypothetical protein [Gemella cuniculi]|uniref:hypothetical protein n=1 Tax=Gemella cuniculi TaxID=150240 RepID=UPI0004867A10|nr:hypothetical protein [Gemella cuniculi]